MWLEIAKARTSPKMKAHGFFPAGQRMRSGDSLLGHKRWSRWCRLRRRPARPQGRCVRRHPNSPIQKRSHSKATMHWVVSCISNLAKRESEAAPKSRRLQMMTRVQLDASHVSGSVTARREKVSRYIRVSQRTSEVRTFSLYSLRLRVLEYAERELVHGSLREFLSVTLSIWWFSHWLGRWSAIGRSGAVLFFCKFLRWIAVKDGGGTSIQVWQGKAPTFWSKGRIRRHVRWTNLNRWIIRLAHGKTT